MEAPKATPTSVRFICYKFWNRYPFQFDTILIAVNISPVNYENRVGAVGFVSVLFPSLLPLGLIKVDQVTGVEIRGPDGLCQRCSPVRNYLILITRNSDCYICYIHLFDRKKVIKDQSFLSLLDVLWQFFWLIRLNK